ncbi:hypothetical protein BKA65DRAFT_514826 [Rhexocercosporidium sp. MPI-PUGE-AT-0058]|nr:hypothetical protein BKA65DRAFT_514826 [Rhexocercosporidium sp. MPI-PUGE-AT-0058]
MVGWMVGLALVGAVGWMVFWVGMEVVGEREGEGWGERYNSGYGYEREREEEMEEVRRSSVSGRDGRGDRRGTGAS